MKSTFSLSIQQLRLGLVVGLIAALSATAQTDPTPTESGEARADRLLSAVGGRSAWARVNVVIVEATHYSLTAPTIYDNRIVNDLTRPRVRFEAHASGWDRWATIDGDTGTYRRDNEAVVKRTPEQVATDRDWWAANLYRTFRRLAKNDPALTARAIGEERLDILEDGKLLNWFRLNEDGAPVLYGNADPDSTGTIFGPLRSNPSGIRYPEWGAGENGAFRYRIEKFTVNPLIEDEAFAIPEPTR